MAKLYNLARMSTSTTGTGTITLGSAVTGFLSFADAGIQDGDQITYAIKDGSNSEIGRGVYTASGTTLTRSVLKSTNSDAAINLSGAAQVAITAAAEDFNDAAASGVNPNLLINGDFQINQRVFGGGVLGLGVYGFDRWKAVSASTVSLSGYVLTLTSGQLEQIVEPGLWGYASFASMQVTVSVDTPSADLTVNFGSQSGTITAGSGRRSVTLTLGAGDTGNLSFKIKRSTVASCTFGRVKLEVGASATGWQARAFPQELTLCRRYYTKSYDLAVAPGTAGARGGQCNHKDWGSTSYRVGMDTRFPLPMRAVPTVTWYSTQTGASGKIYTYGGGGADWTVHESFGVGSGGSGHPRTDATGALNQSWEGQFVADAEL